MLTFCHDTCRHENCRFWKNHHGNTVIGSTIVNATEHIGPPGFYAGYKIIVAVLHMGIGIHISIYIIL